VLRLPRWLPMRDLCLPVRRYSIAGTGAGGGGCDTAVVMKPANAHSLLILELMKFCVNLVYLLFRDALLRREIKGSSLEPLPAFFALDILGSF